MTSLAMFLMSNQYWYGFFLGSMGVLVLATFVALAMRLRRLRSR